MDPIKAFHEERKTFIKKMFRSKALREITASFMKESWKEHYSYVFDWLGVPIIQIPQDIVAMQEIIWRVKPDLIIEAGIARGGSLIFYASMLELLGKGKVLGIDIDIRKHNRKAIESNPMAKRITMIEGSSTSEKVATEVARFASSYKTVLVCLDSLHTHEHVLNELKLYAPLVSKGSYLVVFDTMIEDMPERFFKDRPWDKGNNPATAVKEFLKTNRNFAVDKDVSDKLLVTASPGGYLKRVR
jgi:cephalosporin hydroxylase